MITAWRLCRRPYADLTGEGGRRASGRWNERGLPIVYLADHPALAVLEVRVNLDLDFDVLPDDYVLLKVDLPEASVELVPDLPPDTTAFGSEWLRAKRTAVLQVPSVIVPNASNFLLNPNHSAAVDAKIRGIEAFRFDKRLWTGATSSP